MESRWVNEWDVGGGIPCRELDVGVGKFSGCGRHEFLITVWDVIRLVAHATPFTRIVAHAEFGFEEVYLCVDIGGGR